MDGYWDSWAARQRQHLTRELRTRRFVFEGEPVKKGDRRSARHTESIRDQVAQELRAHRHGTLRGPVAISVHFSTSRAQPPDLPKLTKFILDVLSTDTSGCHRRPALYGDDRQISMLHATWSTADGERNAQTRVVARPLRDVVADLRLARDAHRDSTYTYSFDEDDSPFELSHPVTIDDLDLDRHETAALPPELRAFFERYDREKEQRALLQHTGRILRWLLASGPERIRGSRRQPRTGMHPQLARMWDQLDEAGINAWNTLLTRPLVMPLPGLPVQHGDHERFRRELDEELRRIVNTWPVLIPLELPLNATLLVVPPPQGKDLDNLALTVVPALRATFRSGLPAIAASLGYQVIELTRQPNDPPSGSLRVSIDIEYRYRSDWDRISAYAEELIERLAERDE